MPSPYLEGLLAAARPHGQRAAVPPRVEPLPTPAEAAVDPVAASEDCSLEERIKRALHPHDSFVRLLDCASANHPPDPDDRFRFQWLGLFYQAPAQDAFTLRLRLPGGRLRPFQLGGLAGITQRYAGGQVLFNSQGGLDLPGVPITSAAEILAQVESVGLSARRTGGDCVQAIRGGEIDDGMDGAPVYPLVCALEQALAHGPVFSDLPFPGEIIFAGASEISSVREQPSIDTIHLRIPTKSGASSQENSPPTEDTCFLLHLPGEAKEGVLLPPHQVIPGCLALLKSWAAGADRSSRARARLAPFLAGLDAEATGAMLGDAKRVPWPLKASPGQSQPVSGLAVPGERLLSGQLAALERGCQEQGWREIRLRHGHLYAADAHGKIIDAATALQRALSM